MPKFLASQIKSLPFDFEAEVAKFVQAKKDHLLTEGVPAPQAHHAVEAAVRRIPGTVAFVNGKPDPSTQTMDDYVADYEIVPDPLPSLDEHKMKLAGEVNAEANALLEQITPRLKSKSLSLKFNKAIDVPKDERTAEHHATIADWESRRERSQAIFEHVAELESQIDDLTEATIGAWQPSPFPT